MAAKVLTIVGARPQFIKAAVLSHELSNRPGVDEIIVHTGQHYDANMSQVFFEELGLPQPKVNLGISGGTHAEMTGAMMVAIEGVLQAEAPDAVLLYGDTNSTLAGALAAAKLAIPICHAESGARTGSRENPEEINRICTDHLSAVNCAPTPTCLDNLVFEGMGDRSSFTGDLMYDAYVLFSSGRSGHSDLSFTTLDGKPFAVEEGFCYLTCHRQENTSDEKLRQLFIALNDLDMDIVYPVHPRMRDRALKVLDDTPVPRLTLLSPVGYLESLFLLNSCRMVITDSGGLQREAFFAEKKCVTLLPFSSTEELLTGNRNTLVPRIEASSIVDAAAITQVVDPSYMPFGDGRAAAKIADRLESIV